MRPPFTWRLRTRSLELGPRTLIMGVINVTPDSFSDGGLYFDRQRAIQHGLRLLDEGADLLDIGGESTRPGARVAELSTAPEKISTNEPVSSLERRNAAVGVSHERRGGATGVSPEEEIRRVVPVIEGVLRARPDAVISVDTYKAVVAGRAISAGAEIVNDVSAGAWDALMLPTVANLQCGAVLMHTRGRPEEWRTLPPADDMAAVVCRELEERVKAASAAGVARQQICLDPGFGFGKNFDENYPLLAGLKQLADLGFPLVAGTSRKGFIGRTLAHDGKDLLPRERLYGSLAAMTASILNGAHIVRVHDAAPSVHAARIADEILRANRPS
jgi:dihydropteroate synthase